MARSLPENTVDAWASIALSRQGSPWIWLPTTNQGGTLSGSHPGDISTVLGRRLILIENKGIEDGFEIDFGSDGRNQRDFLRNVEESGLLWLRTAGTTTRPPALGWVFYGLPLLGGPVNGTGWSRFGSSHSLLCPHDADSAGLGDRSATLGNAFAAWARATATDHTSPGLVDRHRKCASLRLNDLLRATHFDLVGLPIERSAGRASLQIRHLVAAAYAISVSSETTDPGSQDEAEPETSILDLLTRFASAAQQDGQHLVAAVL